MCCGKSRAQFRGTPAAAQPSGLAPRLAPALPSMLRNRALTFEYIGRTRLAVTGAVTGRQYRFDRSGARVEVDPRDRPSIAAIPVLRQVR